MPIDLSGIKDKEIEVKLRCGYMFWEVDYAKMDFSQNIKVETKIISTSSATDEQGSNVALLLNKSDNKFLTQPSIGNQVNIEYNVPIAKNGYQQTFFLHSRGNYEYIRDYKNKPDYLDLLSYLKEGSFTHFAKEQYNIFSNTTDFFANQLKEQNAN